MDQTLRGSADDLKEYVIGVEVFDRTTNYDPRLDPIVRVEARRLRLKLRQYYDQDGASDYIRIEIPDRGYAPAFKYMKEAIGRSEPSAGTRQPGASLAVLSLASGVDTSADLFANGLTDEIVCVLTGMSDVQVAARAFTPQRGHGADVTTIGRNLNVEFILEGNVRWEASTIRVCVQLVKSESGFCLWSQAYEQEIIGILEGQKRIASQIATDLRSYLNQRDTYSHRFRRSPVPSVHALYTKGRSYLNSRTKDGFHQSIQCFQKLIDTCPENALAYSGLADAYSLGARYDVFPHQESWQRAHIAALQAVKIDYTLAEAHTSLGFVDLHYRRDWWSAEREFCTAILLNPSYAPALQWYGWYLAATGHHEMAVRAVEQAVRMDPLSPNANADLALAYYFSRQYTEAIEQCNKTLLLKPGFVRPYQLSALAHLQRGDFPNAIDQLKSAISLAGGNGRGTVLLAHTYAAMDQVEDAREVFAKSMEARKSVSAIDFVLYFTAIGNMDKAFEWLERAYVDQDAELIWLSVDPIYDRVRQDPRFTAFLGRMVSPPLSGGLSDLLLTSPPRN
ncbi:MAG TPA: tetratricopeptide repeat protein [Bryobacteraceae bacterium]|nr:tetratricopeptide repeat protein [Bryobacteraceae bacterium]